MKINILLIGLALIAFSSCQKLDNTLQQPAHLRLINLMPDADKVEVGFYPEKKGEDFAESLTYKTPTDYKDIKEGKYLVKVTADNKVLLSKDFGFGPDGYYTIVIGGLSQLSMKPNQRTFTATVKWVAGGASADLENGLLPQIYISRDNVGGSEKESKLRVAHWAPGVVKASLSAYHDGKEQKMASVSYAKSPSAKSYKAGKYDLLVKLGGGNQAVLKKEIDLQPCTLYTVLIAGTPDKGYPLNLVILQNPLKPCLNK